MKNILLSLLEKRSTTSIIVTFVLIIAIYSMP